MRRKLDLFSTNSNHLLISSNFKYCGSSILLPSCAACFQNTWTNTVEKLNSMQSKMRLLKYSLVQVYPCNPFVWICNLVPLHFFLFPFARVEQLLPIRHQNVPLLNCDLIIRHFCDKPWYEWLLIELICCYDLCTL